MSAVVYARVPDSLKQALEAHASARGRTQTGAVVELVEHGLEAIANEQSVAELERKLAVCSSEGAQTRARLQEAELRLQAAGPRGDTYRALAERTRQQLASCPQCRQPCAATICLSAATAPTAASPSPRC